MRLILLNPKSNQWNNDFDNLKELTREEYEKGF